VEFSLLAGFAAPSLVGNTIVLKPASATQRGIEIEKWFNKIGTPD
jgi:acyl-CoA reductase-like NAD-dependent aldehyde dehydrogenase